MRAVTYQGPNQVKVAEVEDAKLEKKDDIVIKITSTAICGSDLHLYQGSMPLPHGYIIGHEPMGIVEEVGPDVTKVKKGDRVIIPFNVACGQCAYCKDDLTSQCDNSNPYYDSGGYFGYTEKFGNHPGGQAEYLKVPFGNFTPFVIPVMPKLYDQIVKGEFDPKEIITHKVALEDAANAYKIFNDHQDNCIKVILKP